MREVSIIYKQKSMPLPETIRREFEVAFSKHSQPPWFRILKYVAITILAYFLWGTQ
jgi:hypothetical protein